MVKLKSRPARRLSSSDRSAKWTQARMDDETHFTAFSALRNFEEHWEKIDPDYFRKPSNLRERRSGALKRNYQWAERDENGGVYEQRKGSKYTRISIERDPPSEEVKGPDGKPVESRYGEMVVEKRDRHNYSRETIAYDHKNPQQSYVRSVEKRGSDGEYEEIWEADENGQLRQTRLRDGDYYEELSDELSDGSRELLILDGRKEHIYSVNSDGTVRFQERSTSSFRKSTEVLEGGTRSRTEISHLKGIYSKSYESRLGENGERLDKTRTGRRVGWYKSTYNLDGDGESMSRKTTFGKLYKKNVEYDVEGGEKRVERRILGIRTKPRYLNYDIEGSDGEMQEKPQTLRRRTSSTLVASSGSSAGDTSNGSTPPPRSSLHHPRATPLPGRLNEFRNRLQRRDENSADPSPRGGISTLAERIGANRRAASKDSARPTTPVQNNNEPATAYAKQGNAFVDIRQIKAKGPDDQFTKDMIAGDPKVEMLFRGPNMKGLLTPKFMKDTDTLSPTFDKRTRETGISPTVGDHGTGKMPSSAILVDMKDGRFVEADSPEIAAQCGERSLRETFDADRLLVRKVGYKSVADVEPEKIGNEANAELDRKGRQARTATPEPAEPKPPARQPVATDPFAFMDEQALGDDLDNAAAAMVTGGGETRPAAAKDEDRWDSRSTGGESRSSDQEDDDAFVYGGDGDPFSFMEGPDRTRSTGHERDREAR